MRFSHYILYPFFTMPQSVLFCASALLLQAISSIPKSTEKTAAYGSYTAVFDYRSSF